MDKRKVIVLLIAASMMAGCTEIIPDPPTDEEIIANAPDWENLNGTYTVLVGVNNSTAPSVTVGNNTTWLEVKKVYLNATHLSFEVDGNAITFNNYSFALKGYLNQSGNLWSNGHAPDMGNATLYTPDYPYDITIDYVILYREWNGKE